VVPSGFNQPPAARMVLGVNSLALTVNASGSSDPDGSIASYVWNFGEGASASNNASGVTAAHTYATPGSYLVTLLVTDNQGGPAVNQQKVTVTGLLNDTGVTASQCYEAGSNVLVSCAGAGAGALNGAQDGMRGRDVTSNSAADGVLGFSYNMVGGYAKTECVKDTITGLIWEGKTSDGGLRDGAKVYTNYDNTAAAQFWNGSAYVNPTQPQIDADTNAVGYKNAVNAGGLCGASDWRLPSVDELESLVVYGLSGPAIDTAWFPNASGTSFWSSSTDVEAGYAYTAWYVSFSTGVVNSSDRGRAATGNPLLNNLRVRLVRTGQ
jgi:PKD repeat protein